MTTLGLASKETPLGLAGNMARLGLAENMARLGLAENMALLGLAENMALLGLAENIEETDPGESPWMQGPLSLLNTSSLISKTKRRLGSTLLLSDRQDQGFKTAQLFGAQKNSN